MTHQTESDRIRGLLAEIETQHGVRVLMAVESGSRAWGFASPDSDFDVRFVYQEPVGRMLRLYPDRDVIEQMSPYHPDGTGVPIDLVGWSLPKALRLAAASNPQLCEWARGTVTYQADPDFMDQLRLLTVQASPRVLAHHYRGLAKKTVLDYLGVRVSRGGRNTSTRSAPSSPPTGCWITRSRGQPRRSGSMSCACRPGSPP